MDPNDPEQRIRDLERQLADAQKAAQDSGQRSRNDAMGSYGTPPPPMQRFTSEAYGYPTYGANPYRTGRRSIRWVFLVLPLVVLGPLVSVLYHVAHDAWQSSGPKACDIFTADIAKSVLGDEATKTREAKPNSHETQCQYKSPEGWVDVSVGSWTAIKPIWSDMRAVPGLGDEASISDMGLYVRKGSVGLEVHMVGMSTDNDRQAQEDEAAQAIAKQLLPKL
jgi:hypothetical protein